MNEWLHQNWQDILAALGIGSGSGIIVKKIIDTTLKKRIEEIDKEILFLQKKIELNRLRDEDLRNQVYENNKNTREWLLRIEEKIDSLLSRKNY